MSTFDGRDSDWLIWRFPIIGRVGGFDPRMTIDAPGAWVQALDAVGRDLRCLRYGRDIALDESMWEFALDGNYCVVLGWHGRESGWQIGRGMTMDASFAEAAVWVADTVQTQLAGSDFVQWPSRGRYLLSPALRDAAPVWVDPHTGAVVAPIGELCE